MLGEQRCAGIATALTTRASSHDYNAPGDSAGESIYFGGFKMYEAAASSGGGGSQNYVFEKLELHSWLGGKTSATHPTAGFNGSERWETSGGFNLFEIALTVGSKACVEVLRNLDGAVAVGSGTIDKSRRLSLTQSELEYESEDSDDNESDGEEGAANTDIGASVVSAGDVSVGSAFAESVTAGALAKEEQQHEEEEEEEEEQQQHRVWLVVSSPEYGSDGKGGYKFPTMNEVVALSKERANLMIGYDWANSTSAFEKDGQLFGSVFEEDEWGEDWDGKSEEDKARIKQENESKAARIWKKTKGGTQMQALMQISDVVKQTSWYKAYVGKVKGAVSTLCQQGRAVTLVCVEGGPVTRVEQMEMTKITMEIKDDLRASYSIDADIDQKTFATFHEMKQCFELGVGSTSQSLGSPRFRSDSADDGGDNVSATDGSSNGNGSSSGVDGGDSIGRSGDSGGGYQGQRWLIFLRHGESEGNVDEELYKNAPTSRLKLTKLGQQQAVDAGRSIVDKIGSGRVAIFCSSF
jgi:hypothetical protein